jgi:glutathione S-transferase
MRLVIGNKNYSSWSMRPWVLMRQAGIAFDEVLLRFGTMAPDSPFKRELAAFSPVGKVPVLIDDAVQIDGHPLAVWDTLAIAEYLAERFPDKRLWPDSAADRARARSVCAEMHSGFGALRNHCPMNIEAALTDTATMAAVGARALAEHEAVRSDLARIVQIWSELLQRHGGPMLFGGFSIADAYFAPVCSRIRTYGLPVPAEITAYIDRVFALPGVAAWVTEAMAEHDFVEVDEPYRSKVGKAR